MSITLEQVKQSEEITSYIRKADESLSALGFTEHSFAHVGLVSAQASAILKTLGYDDRTCELAAIAGWLHDIGNVINRIDHAQSGAVMAFRILDKMGAAPEETATIITAIGNHDEKTAFPVNPVAAALILADKMDVRANRVRPKARAAFDIHDRVNYSVKKHEVTLTDKEICLTLAIDTEVCAVIEYFEIFMDRMLLWPRGGEAGAAFCARDQRPADGVKNSRRRESFLLPIRLKRNAPNRSKRRTKNMETLEKLRNGIDQLPKWLLLVLVIFLDGLVGGLYRAAGKTTAAKVIGWIMAAAYVLSILSFVELPAALATVSRIVTVVCMIADIITVITSGKITFFAD
ncbi:MAG: hypothetical protein ACLUFI_09995 [Oscillospiraceae bacterium]